MDNLVVKKEEFEKISDKIKKEGVCIVKNFVKKEDLENLERDFEKILLKNKNDGCFRVMNFNILNSYKYISKYFLNSYIKKVSNLAWGKYIEDSMFIHKDTENKLTNNVYPHFDFARKLKFYICVNNMNLDNGCFKILPGKNELVNEKRKINPRNNIFTPGHLLYNGTEIKMEEMIPVIADAGDLIIFDTNCIHCGGDNFVKGKCRKVIRLHLK